MRAAALFSAAVIAAGVFLAVAAMLGLSTSWTAMGILGIATLAAVGVMASERQAGSSLSR